MKNTGHDHFIKFVHKNGEICYCHPAKEMFDPNSYSRNLLRSHSGIDFKSDQEVYDWIIKKDILDQGHSNPEIVHQSLVPGLN